MKAGPLRRRPPSLWAAVMALAVLLGIGSRRYAASLPWFVAAYAGDTLWALAAFLGIGLILPRASTRRVSLLTLTFSGLVEVSQLSKAPWLEAIRHTTLGGLILGYDFVASDLACYAVGVGLGVIFESVWMRWARVSDSDQRA